MNQDTTMLEVVIPRQKLKIKKLIKVFWFPASNTSKQYYFQIDSDLAAETLCKHKFGVYTATTEKRGPGWFCTALSYVGPFRPDQAKLELENQTYVAWVLDITFQHICYTSGFSHLAKAPSYRAYSPRKPVCQGIQSHHYYKMSKKGDFSDAIPLSEEEVKRRYKLWQEGDYTEREPEDTEFLTYK